MQMTSWALAAALALASSVAAQEHPRIYFPRQVKREFTNSTITSAESVPPPNNTPGTSSASTKRDDLGDFISDVFDGVDPSKPTSPQKPSVKTVVIQSTVVVTPTNKKGTGNVPQPTVQPTSSPKKTDKETTDKKTSNKSTSPDEQSTDSGILVGPTGIVTTSPSKATPKTTSSAPVDASSVNETEPATESASEPATTKGGLLDPIETFLGSVLPVPDPEPTTNTTVLPVETSTASVKPTTTSGSAAKATTTSAPVVKPTTTSTGILDHLSTLVPTLLPGPATTSSQTGSLEEPATVTSGSSPVTTSSGDTVSTDGPIISSITVDIPVINSTSIEDPITLPPVTTSSPVSVPITTSVSVPVSVSEPVTEPTDVPVVNVTSSAEPTVVPVTPTTSLPETTAVPPSSSVELPPTVDNSTVVPPATTEPSVVIPTSAPVATSVQTSVKEPVTSIRPTATVTDTGVWLPTTMLVEPTSMSYSPPTGTSSDTTAKTLPTNMPKIISSDDPNKAAPEGTVPIQIGFQFPLNYAFVAGNTAAAGQIFMYLPQALADAGGFAVEKVQVSKLVPYDTRDEWGFVSTVAKLHYPETLLDTLQMDLWQPNSGVYNNDNSIVRNLTALINPKIDIFGNIDGDGKDAGTKTNASDDDNDAFDSNDKGDQSSKQKATTAGIAVGAFGLSVMYGAAMFIVARRYKRKRQSHRRSSSITSSQASSEMQYTGRGSPALMGGALLSRDSPGYGGLAGGRESHGSGGGSSARTAGISAPVATENSLGWN